MVFVPCTITGTNGFTWRNIIVFIIYVLWKYLGSCLPSNHITLQTHASKYPKCQYSMQSQIGPLPTNEHAESKAPVAAIHVLKPLIQRWTRPWASLHTKPRRAVFLLLDAYLSGRSSETIQAERPKLNAPLKLSLIHEHPVSVPTPPPPSIVKPQCHKPGPLARAFLSSHQGNWNSVVDVPVERWRIGDVISDDTSSESTNKSKNSPVTSHHRSNGRHFSAWPQPQKLASNLPV